MNLNQSSHTCACGCTLEYERVCVCARACACVTYPPENGSSVHPITHGHQMEHPQEGGLSVQGGHLDLDSDSEGVGQENALHADEAPVCVCVCV
jgi:hypothetical protein